MTDKKEFGEVWEEMEEIEPLTPTPPKNTSKDVIQAKVMFDSGKPLSKWR